MISVGQIFGRWKVIMKSHKPSHWICECECGNSKSVYVSHLTQGKSTQCSECRYSRPLRNLTGDRVGQLLVLGYIGVESGSRGGIPTHHWLCECDCGNKCRVRGDHLGQHAQEFNKNKSCGCRRRGSNNHAWKGVGELSGEKWAQILKGARTRDIKVSVSAEQVWALFLEQDRRCALTGWELTLYSPSRSASADTDASLDRIDSSEGYIPGNIQWVHKWVNQAKNDLAQNDFVDMCRAIGYRAAYLPDSIAKPDASSFA